jgi:hypothetical protein
MEKKQPDALVWLALKGHTMTAQGTALGGGLPQATQALKGRNRAMPPFQGSRCSGSREPRALPWADIERPVGAAECQVTPAKEFVGRNWNYANHAEPTRALRRYAYYRNRHARKK